jgi:hypothetical protein
VSSIFTPAILLRPVLGGGAMQYSTAAFQRVADVTGVEIKKSSPTIYMFYHKPLRIKEFGVRGYPTDESMATIE